MQELGAVIPFVFSHQVIIIEGLFALILAIVVLWLLTHLREESEKPDIEGTLKRILAANAKSASASAQTASATSAQGATTLGAAGAKAPPAPAVAAPPPPARPALTPLTPTSGASAATPAPTPAVTPLTPTASASAAPAQASAAAPTPVAPAAAAATATPGSNPTQQPNLSAEELERLKKELDGRDKQISELEKSITLIKADLKKAEDNKAVQGGSSSSTIEGGGAAGDSSSLSELQSKLAALEARLKEYEIIEDDLANLATYKQENVKIKEELNRLKNDGGGGGGLSSQPKKKTEGMVESPGTDFSKVLKTGTEIATEAGSTTPAQLVEEQGVKEGEKLISEFQNFMKGKNP